MFVKKEYRGKVFGVSQQLLNTAINKCIDNNFNVIYLGTLEIFKEAQKFYEKNNFVNISKEELPRNFPNNPIDTVFYKLEIQKTL